MSMFTKFIGIFKQFIYLPLFMLFTYLPVYETIEEKRN